MNLKRINIKILRVRQLSKITALPVEILHPAKAILTRSIAAVFAFFLLLQTASAQQTGITRIYTDFNGFWTSSSTSISPIRPDNSHNLLGFTWNNQTYSTGVNDALLTTNGVSFIPMNFQAFPVRNINLAGTGALPGLGQLKDGVDNGASTPPPFSTPPNIAHFLTDGIKGLDIGTGIANIPTGTIIFDFGGIIDVSHIGDGLPDILVSQIADPSSTLDSVYFTDGVGNLVGNKIAINHTSSSIPPVGKWVADFYNSNGTLSPAYIKTERNIRIWGADISAFGITAANYNPALTLRYKLNGSSDPAFLAFNSNVIQVTSANNDIAHTVANTPVAIDILANDQPAAQLNKSSVQVTSAPAHGTLSINSSTGVVTYTPNINYSGIDNFVYQVCNNGSIPQCDDATVTVNVGNADLRVSQTVSNSNPPLLSQVVFSIKAENLGVSNGYGIKVDDLLASGFSFVSATASAGSYNNTTGVWTIGAINNLQEVTLQITAQVNATGVYNNKAVVSGILYDPNHVNDTSLITLIPTAASSDLQVTKTVSNNLARADSTVTFSIVALNNGPSYSASNAVTDILPSGFSFVSATAPTGTSYNALTGAWSVGSLSNGASKTLLIQAVVQPTGNYTNTASITGSNADNIAANNTSAVTVTPSVGVLVFTSGTSSAKCQLADSSSFIANATHNTAIVYNITPAAAGTVESGTGKVFWNNSFYGTANITATASGINGPVTAQHTVTVNPAATTPVFVSGDSSTRCQATETISYTATSTHATNISYSINPVAAGSINNNTGEVSWNSSFSGTAWIQATATGCNGLVSHSHKVNVKQLPIAQIQYSKNSFCQSGTAVVTITGITGGAFSGTGGLSINTATGEINLAASTTGMHTAYYQFIDGNCSNTVSAAVEVVSNPTVQVNQPAAVCNPGAVDITNASVTAGSTAGLHFEYFLDAAASQALAQPSAISSGGTYYIKGTAANSCYSTVPVTVNIQQKGLTSISYSAANFCSNGSAPVTINGVNGGAFSSGTGLAIDALSGSINLLASSAGDYTILYIYNNSVCNDTAQTIISIANPNLNITNPEPVCAPGTINLTQAAITNGSSAGLSFEYFSDATATIALSNPSAVASSGTYYVRGENSSGCHTEIKPVAVTIRALPVIDITAPTTAVCKGVATTLTATAAGSTITWSQYEGAGNSINVRPITTTTYNVSAENVHGCVGHASTTVTVSNFKASITSTQPSVIAGNNITLSSNANQAYEVIAWKPVMYFKSNAKTQTISVSDSSKTFEVIAQSQQGCLDTASIKIIVENNDIDLFIPNAFTPNNDGKNDIFKVYGSSVKSVEMRIYTQWGALIYETNNNTTGWNGTAKNQTQPVGVYMYVVKVNMYNNNSLIRKGTINLIR